MLTTLAQLIGADRGRIIAVNQDLVKLGVLTVEPEPGPAAGKEAEAPQAPMAGSQSNLGQKPAGSKAGVSG